MALQFTAFNLEASSTCGYDFLSITDGDGTTLMGKTCGDSLPNNITSWSNVIKMVFRTDGSHERDGWSVSWSAISPGLSHRKNEACSDQIGTLFCDMHGSILRHIDRSRVNFSHLVSLRIF